MRLGRAYFLVQAAAGAAWWVGVFISADVRRTTLGDLDPVVVALFDIPLFIGASLLAALGIRAAAIVASSWTALVAIALVVYATLTTLAGWGALVMLAAAGSSVVATCLIVLGRVPTERLVVGPFRFRSAKPAPHVAITIAQMLGFWGVFLVVLPIAIALLELRWQLHLTASGWVAATGFVLLLLASALGVWSALTMATRGRGTPLPIAMPNDLVVSGPYRLVRNPMAVAGIVQGVAVGMVLSSWLVVAYAVVGSVLWNYAVRPLEEADLETRFGDQYREYRNRVRCWVPRVPRAPAHMGGNNTATSGE